MLSRERRVRAPADFSQTLRSGARAGRRNVVVSAYPQDPDAGPLRAGFIVSKAVGNAVTRNRVKRRLRAAVASQFDGPLVGHPGAMIVVRALPPSSTADWRSLRADVDSALSAALRKADGRRRGDGRAP